MKKKDLTDSTTHAPTNSDRQRDNMRREPPCDRTEHAESITSLIACMDARRRWALPLPSLATEPVPDEEFWKMMTEFVRIHLEQIVDVEERHLPLKHRKALVILCSADPGTPTRGLAARWRTTYGTPLKPKSYATYLRDALKKLELDRASAWARFHATVRDEGDPCRRMLELGIRLLRNRRVEESSNADLPPV